MKTITISTKNQIVVPKQVRGIMQLTGGDQLIVARVTKDEVVLRKAPSLYDFIGSLKSQNDDPVERIRKLRDDWR